MLLMISEYYKCSLLQDVAMLDYLVIPDTPIVEN